MRLLRIAASFAIAVMPWMIPVMGASQTPIAVTVENNEAGSSRLVLTNQGTKVLTAFVIISVSTRQSTGKQTHQSVFFFDNATSPHQPVLAPGNSWKSPFFGGAPSNVGVTTPEIKTETTLGAGIFEDGTSMGDSKWVTAILSRRNGLFQAYRGLDGILSAAVNAKTAREDVETQISVLSEKLLAGASDEHFRKAARAVLDGAKADIAKDGNWGNLASQCRRHVSRIQSFRPAVN